MKNTIEGVLRILYGEALASSSIKTFAEKYKHRDICIPKAKNAILDLIEKELPKEMKEPTQTEIINEVLDGNTISDYPRGWNGYFSKLKQTIKKMRG